MFSYSIAEQATETGFVMVTDRFVCLLGAATGYPAATALYRLLDTDDTHIDDVFDLIVTRHNLSQFAVVEMVDSVTRAFRVAVRGNVLVELEGATTTRLSGVSTAAWASSEATGVRSLRLSLTENANTDDRLPMRHGVVRASGVTLDASAKAVSRPRGRAKANDSAAESPLGAISNAATLVGWLLTLPDGRELEARLPIVIGRRPWPEDSDESSVVHVVAPSPNREISGSHLELIVVAGELFGRDLDSTNGTVVHTGARPPRLLHGGRSTPLRSGDILDVGEAFSVVVSTKG